MSKNQFTGIATQPQRNRKLGQFNKDQYCTSVYLDELFVGVICFVIKCNNPFH